MVEHAGRPQSTPWRLDRGRRQSQVRPAGVADRESYVAQRRRHRRAGRSGRRGARRAARLQPRVRRSARRSTAARAPRLRCGRRWSPASRRPPANAPAFLAPLLYQAGNDGRARGASAFADITKGTTPRPSRGSATARRSGSTRSAGGVCRTGRSCSPRSKGRGRLRGRNGQTGQQVFGALERRHGAKFLQNRDRIIENTLRFGSAVVIDQQARQIGLHAREPVRIAERAELVPWRRRSRASAVALSASAAASSPSPRASCARRNGRNVSGRTARQQRQ